MRTSSNPWADALLGQVWFYQQFGGVMLRCIDLELGLEPAALSDFLDPCKPRLNPLEFHGTRRCASDAPTLSPRVQPAAAVGALPDPAAGLLAPDFAFASRSASWFRSALSDK
jgi:hypothetical protein